MPKIVSLGLMSRRSQQSQNPRAMRRFREWEVDQVFLRRVGGRIQANVWTVSSENEVQTERWFTPSNDPVTALRWLGDQIAAKGTVQTALNVRVRWARDEAFLENLIDDTALEDEFRDAFELGIQDTRDSRR
jgi:hypothetical protein